MSDIQKKESIGRKYRWHILALLITSFLTIAGAVIRAQTQMDLGLIMFIGGSLLSMTIFLGTLTMKAREDVDEIITDKIGRVENEFRKEIEEIRSNLAAVWTPTIERNLDVAIEITGRIGREGSNGTAYDTSSHVNPPEYENMVLENLRKGVCYERLICFDPTDKDNPAAKWYFHLMDGRQDKDNHYEEWRKMIDEGKLQVLHLPRTLDTDILVTNKKGTNRYDTLLGFTTEETLSRGVYNSGLYVPTPTQSIDKNLAHDLFLLFKKLWREAHRHAMEQTQAEPELRCDCNQYVRKIHGDKVKIVPIHNTGENPN